MVLGFPGWSSIDFQTESPTVWDHVSSFLLIFSLCPEAQTQVPALPVPCGKHPLLGWGEGGKTLKNGLYTRVCVCVCAHGWVPTCVCMSMHVHVSVCVHAYVCYLPPGRKGCWKAMKLAYRQLHPREGSAHLHQALVSNSSPLCLLSCSATNSLGENSLHSLQPRLTGLGWACPPTVSRKC